MFIPRGPHGYGPPVTEPLGLAKTSDGGRIWQIERGRNTWHTAVRYWHMQVSGLAPAIPAADYEARKFDLESLPAHFRPKSIDDLHMMAWYRETGFPFGAMTCSVHWERQIRNEDVTYHVTGGVQLPRDADFQPRALPLTPVWPGFALDMALWGGLWLGLAWLLRSSRRRWRARKNRCIHCGYPRTGLPADTPCPECGRKPSG